jgi:hypothetical protein
MGIRLGCRRNGLFTVALASFLLFQPAADSHAAQSPEERAQLDWVLERGQLLFGIDRAAWVATDDMVQNIPDPVAAGLRGYIVEPVDDGFEVVFFAGDEPNLVQAYRGQVRAGGVVAREVFPNGARPSLTPSQRALVSAVVVARGIPRKGCSDQPFNPLAIPPQQPGGPVDVYLMTPQTGDDIPFGLHYRVTVDANGVVQSERSFSNSCLAMPPPPPNASAFVVTHLLDPQPTEIHVFSALAAERPIFVGTTEGRRVWEVTGRSIRLVEAPR